MSHNKRVKKIFIILFIVMVVSFAFVGQLLAVSNKSVAHLERSAAAAEPDGDFISLDANGNLTALQAQNAPGGRTWYIDNIRFDSGAVASGSFHYDTEPYNPFAGQYGTYSNININVTSPDGTVREFRIVNPDSEGNERYLSMVAATGGDLTGAPFMALTPAISMTNAGGVIDILPGPQDLSYIGVCRSSNCGFADEPYEEALPGGRIIAGPRIWHLDNVRFDSGAVATGSFVYDEYPYNPFAGDYGTYSNIDIDVTSPDGTVREFRIVNPDSEGNERYLSMVAATGGDLTGAPFMALTPAISMTNAGGTIDILPGPQDLSYLGVCRSSNCGFAEEPYEEALAGGRLISNPGPQRWYVEGIRFDSGAVATGYYDYDEVPYNPFAGQYGTYSNINIDVTSPNGTVREFRIVNPDSEGNERYLSMVAATGGDLTGVPFMALTPAISMTNAAGPINILPGPQNLSYLGVCRDSGCTFAEAPYEEAVAGGRIVREVAPPTIISNSSVNVIENQTNAIDVESTDNLDTEGNGLVYSISGGADQALFNVDVNTGVVTFINAPDFEEPGDAGANNVYNLQVTVTDLGGRTAVQDIAITVTDEVEDTTPPTASPTFDPPANSAGWHNGDVTVTWNWTDEPGGSGIDPNNCELTSTLAGEGALAIVGQCVDLSGNFGLQGSGSVNIDKSAPISSPTFDPPANAAGWHNADVTISWNWTDPASANGASLSGIDPDNCEQTSVLAGEGALAIVGQCSDLADNFGLQGSGSVSIDKTAPETAITANPPATGTNTEASFEFSATDTTSGIASFECQLDGDGFSTCESPVNFSSMTLGDHTFEVRAVDLAGNIDPTPASYAWTVTSADVTSPTANPTLNPAPNAAGWNNSDFIINWNWIDEVGGSGLDTDNCQLSTAVTQEGRLNLESACRDLAGNGNIVQLIVRLDRIAPETAIDASPPATSTTGDATFEFSGSDSSTVPLGASGIAGFECMFDNGTIALGAPCTSPQDYTALANGTYTFTVVAIDVSGNRDETPASYSWTVDAPPADTTPPTASPTFDPAPNARGWYTSDVTVTFNWADNEGGSGINPDACNLTTVVTDQGSNVGFGGSCSDLAGNVGEYVDFLLIDKEAPETTITVNPPATSTSADATFEFNGTDAVADDNALAFECQLDSGGFTPCGSSQSYTDLGNGSHTFEVRAIDTAGLVDPTAASYTWTVEVANPNEPPVVSAGDDQEIMLPIVANLAGTATDDGILNPLSFQWTAESGPGTVTFGDATSAATTATFSAVGEYVLRLTASDGELTAFDELTVTVDEEVVGELFATCGGYEVFEIEDGVYEAPDFPGNLIVGTNSGDWIEGTNGRDLILGLGGPDEIYAKRGNDVICAGKGHDYIEGQRGSDLIFGNNGSDWIIGGNGNDEIWGGKGHDYLEGNRHRDTIYGGNGTDVIHGGRDNDNLFGGNGGDFLNGGNGQDFCQGGNGNDDLDACEEED